MTGLSQQDMDILRSYAEKGNRELYWNYLAQHEDSDGYGLLALGVVRNDSMPGKVANNFAQNHVYHHHGKRELTEREWEQFGIDLIQQDFLLRKAQIEDDRPDLALNLPVKDIQLAHDISFRGARIDPDAWTPHQLLEAARRDGGEQAAEGVWHSMLDNSALGIGRAGITLGDIVRYDDGQLPALRYTGALIGASAMASQDRTNTDPDVIGGASFYYMRDRNTHEWSSVSGGGMGGPSIRRVTDPGTIAELDDVRAVRLERQEKVTQFHPLDPHREIARSPFTLAQTDIPGDTTRMAMLDPTHPGHPDHQLHLQGRDAVHRLDALLGRAPDDNSDRMIASVTRLAREHGLARIDHVVLSEQTGQLRPGENVFVVQGRLDDPAHTRLHMKTQLAVSTPVEESFRGLQALHDAPQRRDVQTQQPDEAALAEQRTAPTRSA